MNDRNGEMPAPATDEPDEPTGAGDPEAHFPQEVLADEMPKGEMN